MSQIKPLSGFRILDVTNVLSGPFCGFQLGLLGAEIIKVEALDGDLARQLGANPEWNDARMGISFLAQNAGKRSIAVRLKSEGGREIFKKLVNTSDVIIENFRPGVMDRLGLGYTACCEWKDPIIYCAISGFGQSGPMRDLPAYDQIVQGVSGVMDITGEADTPPYRVGYPIADTIGGLTAAMAIAAALHQKESQYLDVSMLESVLTTMGWAASNYLMHDQEPRRVGNENMTSAPSGAFQTQDGLINIAANQERQWIALIEALGQPSLQDDPRYATRETRKQHRHELKADLEVILKTRPTADWIEVCRVAGVPAGPVLTVAEALQAEHIQSRQFVHTLAQHAPQDCIEVVTNGFLHNARRLTPDQPVEQLGQSTEDILSELGYSSELIAEFRDKEVIR